MSITCDILMATYNGETFLEKQVGSIVRQNHKGWHLFIRDDGSTDGTVDMIRRLVSEHPGRITFVQDDYGSLGAAGNFSALMHHSKAPYIQFADQDDLWEPLKTDTLMAAVQAEEERHGGPVMVFSDLMKINDDDQLLAPSLYDDEGLNPRRVCLNQLLVQNVPYGCATMINRELLELALPVDRRALVHDHWLALLAAAAGRIVPVHQATLRHRIHDSNASRSNNPIRKARDGSARAVLGNRNFDRYFGQLQAQAEAVKERLLQRNIGGAPYNVLDDFINLRSAAWPVRKYRMVRRGFFKHSRLQSLKWLLRV